MEKKKFKVVVVFGEEATNAYGWDDYERMCRLLKQGDGTLMESEFDTEAERDAYIKGIDDAKGWIDASVLSDEAARKKCLRQLIKK